MNFHVKKGDEVVIISGAHKGKRGKLIAEGTVAEPKERLQSSSDVALEDMFLELTEEIPGS